MLNKFEVSVSREEVEGVDTLRYSFEKLLAQAVSDKTSNTGFNVYTHSKTIRGFFSITMNNSRKFVESEV